MWLQNNNMEVNPDKFHLLLSNAKDIEVNTYNEKISNLQIKKLLFVRIDSKLSPEEHAENLCKRKVKISVFGRVSFLVNF